MKFNVDDIEYNYRASRSEEDFSGYYGDLISDPDKLKEIYEEIH